MIDRETFCIPIYKKKLINSEEDLRSYRKKCNDLVEKHDEGWAYAWAQYCGSWNSIFLTDNILMELSTFKDLLDPILNCTQEYIEELKLPGQYAIQLGQSWLNTTSAYGFQEYHRHIPSTISGCIYFSSPKKYGNFYVKNPFEYDMHYELEIFKEKKIIDLEAGDILLFPSNLEHGVMQNPSDKKRHSLCFNFDHVIKE